MATNNYVLSDSFDNYSAADAGIAGWSGPFTSMATGRFGVGQAARIPNRTLSFGANYNTLSFGGSFKINDTGYNPGILIAFQDAGANQVEVRIDASGKLLVSRNATQLVITPGSVISFGVWYDIVFTVTIADAGSYELFLKQTSILSGSGDTKNTANAYATMVQVGQPSFSNVTWDDVWIYDGIVNPGDLRLEELRPDGNGYSSQFTGSDGNSIDNYQLIGETLYAAAGYIESSTAGDIDSQTVSNMPTAPSSVAFVVAKSIMKKSDAGSRTARVGIRTNLTNYESGNIAIAASDLQYSGTYHKTNPNTAGAWSQSVINALELFEKVQA